MKKILFAAVGLLTIAQVIISVESALAQDPPYQQVTRDNYLMGNQSNLLTISVHIWGEVHRPGEYLVPDGTNVLELISRAGGPTEFSNLGNVVLTRGNFEAIRASYIASDSLTKSMGYAIHTLPEKQVIKLNLKDYLEGKSKVAPMILQPGDVVRVKRNIWYTWQSVIRVISQVAIVVQAWYWYSRINQ